MSSALEAVYNYWSFSGFACSLHILHWLLKKKNLSTCEDRKVFWAFFSKGYSLWLISVNACLLSIPKCLDYLFNRWSFALLVLRLFFWFNLYHYKNIMPVLFLNICGKYKRFLMQILTKPVKHWLIRWRFSLEMSAVGLDMHSLCCSSFHISFQSIITPFVCLVEQVNDSLTMRSAFWVNFLPRFVPSTPWNV